MDLHEPLQPVTGSPAAAFDLLLSRKEALPLREMVQDREWNLHLLGAALSHLRSLGLVEVVPGAEPARFSLTPWARERSTLVGKVLARSEKANWQPEDRERLRCSVEAALEQQPGRLLVYASDGTECQDLDFKGCRSTGTCLPPRYPALSCRTRSAQLRTVRRSAIRRMRPFHKQGNRTSYCRPVSGLNHTGHTVRRRTNHRSVSRIPGRTTFGRPCKRQYQHPRTTVLYWALEGQGHDRSSIGTVTELFRTLPPPAAAADLAEWNRAMLAAVAASGLESTPHKRCVKDAVQMLLVDIVGLRD